MHLYIAFDRDTKQEFLLYNKMHISDDNKTVYSNPMATDMIAPIGTFLIWFLNSNFENLSECREFILKYCFENYYYMHHKELKIPYKLIRLKLNWIEYFNELEAISEERQDSFLFAKNLFLKNLGLPYDESEVESSQEDDDNAIFDEDILKTTNDFTNYILNRAEKGERLIEKFKEKYPERYKKLEDDFYSNLAKYENIHDNEISPLILNLNVDFNLISYFLVGIPIYAHNIPYAFYSNDVIEILAIEFKEFITDKHNTVRQCQNCGRYFIPKDLRITKYCDFEYENGKTYREIGKENAYKKKIKSDKLLKLYRKRYMSLASSNSHYHTEKTKMRFEKYKSEGAEMKKKYIDGEISKAEFKRWIESSYK